ncbi:helix-turn-helix domain-containing protein [Tepidanaerobacter syntrophicus]|nr:helix-turn-helix transcriptional regulator [Tepidanaerobacter syntrophicus]
MNIGTRIKVLRNKKGLTAMQLAEMVSISREHLSAVENGIKPISLTTLQKICDALGITLAEFFMDENVNLPPEYQELLENVKVLSPKQLELLNEFLKTLRQ